MSDDAPPPAARVWQMSGGDLDDPAFAKVYCADVVPMLAELPGYLGQFVLLDPERQVLRGFTLWEDAEARARSARVATRMVDALVRLTSATYQGPWNFDVVASDFRGILGRASQRREIDHLLVRVGTFEGGEMADPAVIGALKKHLATAVAPTPGCVGTLLLSDPSRPAALGASFWTDADAAQRTLAAGAAALKTVAASTGSRTSNIGIYEVLVNQPMARSVR